MYTYDTSSSVQHDESSDKTNDGGEAPLKEMSTAEKPPHIRLHPQCGACGYYFRTDDPIIALVGSLEESWCTAYDAFGYPDSTDCRQTASRKWFFCRAPDCTQCARANQTGTVHEDCYMMAIRSTACKDTVFRLWVASICRRPWLGGRRQSPTLHLVNSADLVRGIRQSPKSALLVRLATLPTEILIIILKHLSASGLCRLAAVLDLVSRWPYDDNGENNFSGTLPLVQIQRWHRDQPDSLEQAETKYSGFFRITVDSFGIREVEFMNTLPTTPGQWSDRLSYIIQPIRACENVVVNFKNGLCTLQVQPSHLGFATWDISNPPPDNECAKRGESNSFFHLQCHAIELEGCTGITFFSISGLVYAIHVHTKDSPCAQTTWEHLSPRFRKAVAWVYLPLQGDRVKAFGSRWPFRPHRITSTVLPSFMFDLELGGSVLIGPHYEGRTEEKWLTSDPKIIAYGVQESRPVSAIKGYPKQPVPNELPTPFGGSALAKPFHYACYSEASLLDIRRVSIFNSKDDGTCRGIIFQYTNGGRRAVGQCRVGVDPSHECEWPVSIRIRSAEHDRPVTISPRCAVTVEVSADPIVEEIEQDWAPLGLHEQMMVFWFDGDRASVKIVDVLPDDFDLPL